MAREQLKTLTEPMYYVLLALTKEQHGYAIMQNITKLTEGRVEVGAGTLYALLSRFEKEGIVIQTREIERKKLYCLSELGEKLLTREYARLNQMVKDGDLFFNQDGTLPPIDRGGIEEEEEVLSAIENESKDEPEVPLGENVKKPKIVSKPKGLRHAFEKGLLTT
ncbi:PadR family transcriptional regulator [Sinanaerobacter sp. ZZT-01]|uniref:PadR family transcriptional regulator n=1 Tax=Sinanaerobacter sp. ZZT-01 TaxID=3111540 RepID=UPI002D77B801|nr:helix-turn-helix transcriptional regulator [Sinanaerobacter sp. ZZT-01]WRR94811.1 helix-turn-helix transcriptional regulator [Sinanaerobacter sp. ZZT-01]